MKIRLIGIAVLGLLSLFSCSVLQNTGSTSTVSYIQPFVGTGGHGHTFPGATVPFGLVQLSPDTRLEGWDGCGGYHYTDSVVYGFSHTHLQGTGVSDYGDILFMPTNYKIRKADVWRDAYKSSFKHSSEVAEAGYYKVRLEDYGIDAELTATEHTGIHHYTFQSGDSCRLFIDMMHRDNLQYYDINTIGDSIIYGYRVSKAWAEDQHCYFYAVFSKPFRDFTQLDITYDEPKANGERNQVLEQVQVFSVGFGKIDDLTIKVGISGTDVEGAKANLMAEAKHWNFEQYRTNARFEWQRQMDKLPLVDGTAKEKKNYYTALYHACTTPNLWSDVDGRYRGMDGQVHNADGHRHYTIFSIWDTFRGLHPLLAQIEPEAH